MCDLVPSSEISIIFPSLSFLACQVGIMLICPTFQGYYQESVRTDYKKLLPQYGAHAYLRNKSYFFPLFLAIFQKCSSCTMMILLSMNDFFIVALA